MFDSKMLLVILAIALVIFGTKRIRSIGSDLGAAVKGFKSAMNEGESEEKAKQLKQTRTRISTPMPRRAKAKPRYLPRPTLDAACLMLASRKYCSPRR